MADAQSRLQRDQDRTFKAFEQGQKTQSDISKLEHGLAEAKKEAAALYGLQDGISPDVIKERPKMLKTD